MPPEFQQFLPQINLLDPAMGSVSTVACASRLGVAGLSPGEGRESTWSASIAMLEPNRASADHYTAIAFIILDGAFRGALGPRCPSFARRARAEHFHRQRARRENHCHHHTAKRSDRRCLCVGPHRRRRDDLVYYSRAARSPVVAVAAVPSPPAAEGGAATHQTKRHVIAGGKWRQQRDQERRQSRIAKAETELKRLAAVK